MSVSIDLPADVESALRGRAAAAGTDLSTFIRQVVTESLEDDETPATPTLPTDFAHRLDAWIRLHPVHDHAIDDSRESIYAGRGE
jgi:plasmid stability protein